MRAALHKMAPGYWAVLLVALLHAVRIGLHWHDVPVLPGHLVGPADPDPWLRLTVLRDWLTGGSWYSHLVANSNAPFGGISTPWTRPLDVILAALTYLQPASLPLDDRLIHAAMIYPWLMMLALMCGVVFATRQLTSVAIAPVFAVTLLASMPLMWNYFEVGYADHHSLLAALFLWAVALLLPNHSSSKQRAASGILFGLMLWVSPETLMPMGLIYIGFGLCWLAGDARAMARLFPLAASAAITVTLAVMLERAPDAWFHPMYDSVSVVQAYLLALTALAVALLARLSLPTFIQRACVAVLVAAGLTLLLWLVFPLALRGPMAEVEPYIITTFLPNISEATSIFDKQRLMAISLLCHPVLAAMLCFVAWRRGDRVLRSETALKLGYLCLAIGLLFCVQVRWCYYYYPLVAVTLAPWLAALFVPEYAGWRNLWPARWVADEPALVQMRRRLPILTLAYLAPLLLAIAVPDKDGSQEKAFDACAKQVRIAMSDGSLQHALGNKPLTVFTHTNWGANLLFFTPYRIVASNYHREGKGIEYLWESEKITDLATLRNHFAERHIEVLLQCPVVRDEPSALQTIYDGKAKPVWLKPVPLPVAADATFPPKLFLVQYK